MVAVLLVTGGCSLRSDNVTIGQVSLLTAQVAQSAGSPEVALSICDNLLTRQTRRAELQVCRGDALAALARDVEAGAAYRSALAIDKGYAAAWVGLGRMSLASDPAAAETSFLEALLTAPRNPVALNNLGISRDLQGRHAEAQVAYGEAIAASPEMRAPRVNLALSLALTGKTAEAVTIMRPIGGRPGASIRERHDYAAVLAMDDRPDEAATLLSPELSSSQIDIALGGYRFLSTR